MIFQDPMSSLNRPSPSATRLPRRCVCMGPSPARKPSAVPSICSTGCAFPMPGGVSINIRISSPAACASG
jgi:hypothetical protein